MEKFSYSKLNTFELCPYRYKLQYVDKHYINQPSIAMDFGTLVHFIEETIAKDILANDNEPLFLLNQDKYIDLFINGFSSDDEKIEGMRALKLKYPDAFYERNKIGLNYEDKGNIYIESGLPRLPSYLNENRNLQIVGIEKEFSLPFGDDYVFHGFIDRVFQDKDTKHLIIEDIKTYSETLTHDKLTTPLQFVFYTLAAQELYSNTDISCAYELPLCNTKQSAGTRGYIDRGIKKINSLFDKIRNQEFKPSPSPLCFGCPYSATNPNQLEEAKNLCPYYCTWTKNNKNYNVANEWMGYEEHEAILANFIRQQEKLKTSKVFPVQINLQERRFILRKS